MPDMVVAGITEAPTPKKVVLFYGRFPGVFLTAAGLGARGATAELPAATNSSQPAQAIRLEPGAVSHAVGNRAVPYAPPPLPPFKKEPAWGQGENLPEDTPVWQRRHQHAGIRLGPGGRKALPKSRARQRR